MMKKYSLIVLMIVLSGCSAKLNESLAPTLDALLQTQGVSSQVRESVAKVNAATVKSMEDITTPQQEYYIGRSVSANLFGRYRVYNNPKALAYINKIGVLLTYQSDLPDVYGGYHFMILDSDEINAFAAPGGFIFVTRGMLRCAQNEDEVAAILAHEISHVTNRHGMRSIKSSRWTGLGTLLVAESVKSYSNANLVNLVSSFEGGVHDVINTMVVSGYSRSYELEADKSAYALLERTGYNPQSLAQMLRVMKTRLKPGAKDFASSHPSADDRINELKDTTESVAPPSQRTQRFRKQLANI
ncbi:MAG: hypothetical protein QG558_1746 [Campylobacterota bacterium]|nr:hypothetical protein [Campylobacterota bacterium]